MEETVLFPSPNWFQTSGFVVSCDGWIIYGGPTKSLCALEPIQDEKDGILLGKHKFRAHVVTRAHLDRITCLAISPEWPEKKEILAGSADGMVKQWTLEQIDQKWRLKPTQTHEKHHHDKEEVAGVAYSHDSYAITVGCFGNIWKWDIKSNVVKIFKHLKAFKPTCISCSPHIPLHVAIGTKQGVVFVLDLTGSGKVLYKVRGQDDEITTVSWCPQYEVLVKKALGEPEKHSDQKEKKGKVSIATQRMMKIRQLTDEEKLAISEVDSGENAGDEADVEAKEVEEEILDVSGDKAIDEADVEAKKVEVEILDVSGDKAIDEADVEAKKVEVEILDVSGDKTIDEADVEAKKVEVEILDVSGDKAIDEADVEAKKVEVEILDVSGDKAIDEADVEAKKVEVEILDVSGDKAIDEADVEAKKVEVEILDVSVEKARDEADVEAKEVEVEIQAVKVHSETHVEDENEKANVLEDSGIVKSLPEDSFDETVVEEDDMFDIYKDHEADEFGHKKYQPEEIVVKIKDDAKPADYLAECLELKEEILRRKNNQEQSMESLVKALDDAHIEKTEEMPSTSQAQVSDETLSKGTESKAEIEKVQRERVDHSLHVQKHMLASVGKYGSVRIWSKSGKLVGSCVTQSVGNKNQRGKTTAWTTALWYKADVLLIGDCKSQLLECNPLQIDCKNKLGYRTLQQLHRRGLFCLASGAPRAQDPGQAVTLPVWSAGQDRNVVCYDVAERKTVAVYATCGGFVYDIKTCPYDAGKIGVSVSDGAVRVWETSTSEDDNKLQAGSVSMYWQHVQGKVLCVAWHPSRENLLAFATAEARVGLIDTHAKSDIARNLLPALSGGIYSLCWGEEWDLYACGGGALVVYKANKLDEAPKPIEVSWEGQAWELSAVLWRPDAMLVGSLTGAVAMLTPHYPHTALAVAYVFTKMIHTIDWHPLQTSSSSEESPLKNLIAVCSLDKANTVVILEYVENEDGTKQLNTWKTLTGHKGVVLQVSWSPHDDEMLLSTSQDNTVRVWDVLSGQNTHVFAGHSAAALCGAWSAQPAPRRAVLSGGSDACLRLWALGRHPASGYREPTKEVHKKKKDKKQAKTEEEPEQDDAAVATTHNTTVRGDRKFLMPVLTKQLVLCSIQGVRKMLKMYLEKRSGEKQSVEEEDMEQSYRVNYIKIFGSIKEVNEVLDEELERHEDTGTVEPWIMLAIFRGHIDSMVQFASARDMLCPYLLSMAPCVSLKYWKDTTQLYLAQIDRLVAKGQEAKLFEAKQYGGAVFRKVATQLSVHDVRGALDTLLDAKLYKEAYILCRTRYMDSIAQETLHLWSTDCCKTGNFNLAAVCQIALGNLAEAANYLSKSKDESWLSLAAEVAKKAGQNTFADHVLEKREQIKNKTPSDSIQEEFDQLPSKIELLMRENARQNYMENVAPRDVDKEEKGQGDDKKEDTKNDEIESIIPKENGQGDMNNEAPRADLTQDIKEVKEDINGEVLNGQHEAVNEK